MMTPERALAALQRHHDLDKDYKYLRISVSKAHPHVVIVSLNRPSKRNAIDSTFWKEIGHVFSRLGRGDKCRSVLLVGEGSAFCAGIDVTDPNFLPKPRHDVAHTGLAFLPKLRQMQECFTALEMCPVPIVAAIHGQCIGAGVDLICCADIRVCCCDTAVFSVREVAVGLTADVGTLQRLPKITGNQSLVRDVCLTGRTFAAQEALQMGLVSGVFVQEKLFAAALDLCSTIARHSPVAVQGTKRSLLFSRDHSVVDGLEQVASYNALALQSKDLEQAWKIGSKAKPTFADIPTHSKL